jgi:ribonuclease-3
LVQFFSSLLKYFGARKESNNSHSVSKILTPHKFTELEKIIGFPINNKSHYIQALMHRSFLEELEDEDISNERLEFLGDSVLSLIVAEYLFENFPNEDEGFLTKVRAKLVNKFALSDAAESIGLEKFILINQNLTNTFARASKTVLSDAFEAIIGAIYLDHGLKISKKFIHKVLILPLIKDGDYLIDENYKSQLLEYAQANKLETPNYTVIKVSIGQNFNGIGKGKNKKTAEQNAAKSTLDQILK